MTDRERQLFDLLDAYVTSLSDRNVGDTLVDIPSELVESYPELSEMLDCLDSLDSLAIAPESGQVPGVSQTPGVSEGAPRDGASRDFGRYELEAELGRGGMGLVYRARQKVLGSVVALKMIRSSQLASADEIRRFYQEARAAAGLRHSHIVSVHDVGEVEGQHFLTMDLVEGTSLATLVERGPLEPQQAAELLLSVTHAVQYLHEHQIIHRDLKPSNILLDEAGQPFVTDFGLAKVFEGDSKETASGTIIGTPSYMAPEQAAGRSNEVSPRSDVYSLGAILYEMLTGRPPFDSENPLDTVLQVLEAEPPLPSRLNAQVPADLEAICLRCLEKSPDARMPSAAELAQELERYLQGEAVRSGSTSPWRRCQRWARREPALASRLGVLSVAAIVVQVNYHLDGESLARHLQVMGFVGLWVVLSLICQRLLNAERRPRQVRAGWAAADAICFTGILLISPDPIGPLLIGYPLLIVAAGLWFEVGLVWFMTVVCTISYAVLTLSHLDPESPRHYPVIFAVALAGTGFIVAYQVFRIRLLSRYFDRRGW